LPETSPTSMGKAMINLLPISNDENIQTIMPMPNETQKWDSLSVVFATSSGSVRRNRLSDFTNIRANGKIAMKLGISDRLIGVVPCTNDSDIILATHNGKAIRFATKDLRVFNSRDSMGVRGIKLKESDYVVSLSVLTNDDREFILAVTENGFGKRSRSSEYRRTGRGGQGIANIEISKKNGNVVSSFPVLEGEQLMLATDQGKIIRISVDGGEGNTIRVAGRKTQGVNLFTLADGEKVVSVDRVKEDEEDEEE
jgi:DNA gyrase subunit A